MKKILISILLLFTISCDNSIIHNSIVKTTSLEGKQDTIIISYYGQLRITYDYDLVDSRHSVKAKFIKNFSQLQTK